MSNIVAYLFDLCEQSLNAVKHVIKGGCELVDFISPGFDRNPFFKGPRGYLLSGSSDGFDTGNRPPGHKPTHACGQDDQEGHRSDEDTFKGVEKLGIALHGLAHLQNDAGTDHSIEDAHFLHTVSNSNGFKDRAAATKQLPYGRFTNKDVFPVRHVG